MSVKAAINHLQLDLDLFPSWGHPDSRQELVDALALLRAFEESGLTVEEAVAAMSSWKAKCCSTKPESGEEKTRIGKEWGLKGWLKERWKP